MSRLPAGLARDLGRLTHDPLRYVLWAYPWGEEGTALADREGPEPWQRDVLEYVGEQLRAGVSPILVAVASGHGPGKSATMSWLRDWAMATCEDTRGIVTANTKTQLDTKTLPEMAKWHAMSMASQLFDHRATSFVAIEAPQTWRFDAIPWTKERAEAFAGLHNHGKRILIQFDEASAIDDIIWETVEGALTDSETEIIWLAFGNPTRNTGRFRECWGRHRHRWKTFRVDSRQVSHTNKRQIQEWIQAYGEDSDFVRVRVKGEFPRASSLQLIPMDIVEAAMQREAISHPSDPLVWGLDVARFGDDASVLFRRRGRDARTWAPVEWRGLDTMQVAARVAELARQEKPDALFVDVGGVGAGVYDRLNLMGIPGLVAIQFGSAADRAGLTAVGAPGERYANKRAEMWGAVRQWLRDGGAIPSHEQLRDDLVGVEYGFNAKDEIILERKEDMKKRGLASPDFGDALALTFAHPVLGRQMPDWWAEDRAETWHPHRRLRAS